MTIHDNDMTLDTLFCSALSTGVNMSTCSEFNYKIQAMKHKQLQCSLSVIKMPKQCQTETIQCLQQRSNPCAVLGEQKPLAQSLWR